MINEDLVGLPGRAVDIAGPALILDIKQLSRNVETMSRRCTEAGLALRPHAKTHKSANIARKQIDAGAAGVCCATAHEALTLAGLGITDILLTSPLTERRKMQALADVAGSIALTAVVDHPFQVDLWEQAVASSGNAIRVLIDIDVGMGRTGTHGAEAVSLARRVQNSKWLFYTGVQAYSGNVQHIVSYNQRLAVYSDQMKQLAAVVAALEDAGAPPGTVSGGGTGTMAMDLSMKILTELQCGSYVFMDVQYAAVELSKDEPNPFHPALFVRGRVISANVPGRVTVNAGFKSLSTDGPAPVLRDARGGEYTFFGDEYGLIDGPGAALWKPGDSVDILVPHCDPTAALHDFYHVVDGDTLIDIWRIDARGHI